MVNMHGGCWMVVCHQGIPGQGGWMGGGGEGLGQGARKRGVVGRLREKGRLCT